MRTTFSQKNMKPHTLPETPSIFKKPMTAAICLAAFLLLLAMPGQSQAAVARPETKGPGVPKEVSSSNQEIQSESIETIDQAIVVDGQEGFRATVTYYKKQSDGSWEQEFSVPAIYGRNGGTHDKTEGDGKTPFGAYRFTMAFGTKENPGSILPYHQLTSNDFWVDDPGSAYYNRLVDVSQTVRDWDSAEDMSRQGVSYNYGLALNYNEDCTPGKGSAIFLHCYTKSNDSGSAGCIRIPEDNMRQLIQSVDANTRIVIREAEGGF